MKYLFIVTSLLSSVSYASPAQDFHSIFLTEVQAENKKISRTDLENLHYVPDEKVLKSLEASSLDDSLDLLKSTNLSKLIDANKSSALSSSSTRPVFNKPNLTMVIVPGVFAEFIKNRAFEEVFEKKSVFRDQFLATVNQEKRKGNPNATDSVDYLKEHVINSRNTGKEVSLGELIHVGEISLNQSKVRVILFGTPFASLESLGSAKERAVTFNRRLEKYLALTGNQDLAFVGYSRGTVLGLEMLSRAKYENKSWLPQVKAMISLSGVSLGSSLADDALYNDEAPMHKLLTGIESTMNSLEVLPPDSSLIEKARIVKDNTARWSKFIKMAQTETSAMNKNKDIFSEAKSMIQVDPRSPLFIAVAMWKELGLADFFDTYSDNIERARYGLKQLLLSVKELSTESCTKWWSTHAVPKEVTYYAITAAMANPDANSVEKSLFQNPFAYGNGSYDDTMLIQNRKDYEAISGLALNDSQVSVLQSAFPPNLISSLNSNNSGIKTKFLGIAGTHHWGMALREVNKMARGQKNGFPREALLRALATQVLLDNQ